LFVDFAGAEVQQQTGTEAQSTMTDSEIVVPPWCNWMMNVPEEITFSPIDGDGQEIQEFIYNGTEQVFQSDTFVERYYVSGQSGLKEQAASDNCSWFSEPGVGAGISYSLSSSKFQAYGRDPDTGTFDNRVPGMDIELDNTNPMNLVRTFGPDCSTSSFDTGQSRGAISRENFGADFPLVGLSAGAVTTNNYCTAETTYSLSLPANLIPDLSKTQYVWYGPTITFTAVMTADPAVGYVSRSAQDQTISFTQPNTMFMAEAGQMLQASATSGLDVAVNSNTPGICRIESGRVLPVAAGVCSITASQSGRALFFDAASPVTRAFPILRRNQIVTATGIPTFVVKGTESGNFYVNTTSSGARRWFITQGSDRCSVVNVNDNVKRVARTWQAGIQCYLVLDIAGDAIYNSYRRIWSVGYNPESSGRTLSVTNGS
jgi:hypothetical protein